MNRVVLAALGLLLIAGFLLGPLNSAAEDSVADLETTRPTPGQFLAEPARTSGESHSRTGAPAATQPTYKLVRGTEGYWRIAQDHAGVWWFVSPDGNQEFLNGVTTVQPFQRGRVETGPHFVSRDWDGGITLDGNLNAWSRQTLQRVTDTGFKALGAWCHPQFHQLDVPMTRDLNIWAWMSGAAKRFYSPDWTTTAEHAIKVQVELLKDNRNLVGYYIDNELDWGDGVSGPHVYFDYLPPDDPNRLEVIRVIQTVWTSIEQFNADWNLSIKSWDELNTWQTLPPSHNKSYSRLFAAWLSHLAEDYFRTTSTFIRKYDPNHLILGVRFKGYAPIEVVRASKGYTDAQSLNTYVSDARLDYEMFRMMYEESNQPIIIGEYSFHSLDGRSGNRNTVGFSAQVLDQQARADGYHLFTTRLAKVPWIIGADWFQWADEPPSGRSSDGEDVNFGVVDVDDREYDLLTDSIRQTAPMLNPLHASSLEEDAQQDVWRESFANKPVVNVPFLAKPVRLNGELSDWLPQSKVPGIRHAQTVGLERSKLPLPNVYLGWTDDGLYMGMEVFDQDIQGAPTTGWWWTRDCVEFWVSTRSVPSDQAYYDPYSHQFFFVPIEYPQTDGIAGTVGQWHRDGDALKDNLIPHPDITKAVRIHPDRYVVEMFIPAKALHGFDPKNQPAMAFNIHVRNFQHAIAYFWSAPKEVMTQLRPNTWGNMYLEPPKDVTAQTRADLEAIAP